MGEKGLQCYNTLVTILLNNILLPSRTELALFKCLASPITVDEITRWVHAFTLHLANRENSLILISSL